MILTYGNYEHQLGMTDVTIQKRTILAPGTQIAVGVEHTWNILGTLTTQEGDTATARSAITTKKDALIAAYDVEGKDLTLKYFTGGTHDVLLSSACEGGVRILRPPSFPDGKGVEAGTKRTYSIQARGFVPIASGNLSANGVMFFEEVVEFQEAGQLRDVVETLRTPAVGQIKRRFQAYRASQRGRVIGRFSYPEIPDPLWPTVLVSQRPRVSQKSARYNNGTLTDFEFSYEWNFASSFELLNSKTPHALGVTYQG